MTDDEVFVTFSITHNYGYAEHKSSPVGYLTALPSVIEPRAGFWTRVWWLFRYRFWA